MLTERRVKALFYSSSVDSFGKLHKDREMKVFLLVGILASIALVNSAALDEYEDGMCLLNREFVSQSGGPKSIANILV